jgi:heme-degrading monooxygenase HmoA
MFIVISHHFCKPGQTDIASERVDKNGAAMTGEPGFLYRYRIESHAKPSVVSTLTVWNTEGDYKNFREKRSTRGGHDSQAMPWERIEGESYDVCATHGNAPR